MRPCRGGKRVARTTGFYARSGARCVSEHPRCSRANPAHNARPNGRSCACLAAQHKGMMAVQGLVEAVTHDDAHRLLTRIGVTRVCDLDLLMFFVRHRRALLTSESLASFLGYDRKDIAESLEVLMAAGLLTRMQTPAHAARLYVFADETSGDWLPTLAAFASSREGRLALRRGLCATPDAAADRAPRSERDSMLKPGPRIVAPPKRRTGTE